MEGLDDLLDKDDLLYRLVQYELYRIDNDGKSNRLIISISEGLNRERKGKFYARPMLMVRHSKPDYEAEVILQKRLFETVLRK
jgi:hypothetical protein